MPEYDKHAETPVTVDSLHHGKGVIYFAEIKPRSFVDVRQSEAMQSKALEEILRKMKAQKETVLGTALISSAENDDWPIGKRHSNLIVVGEGTLAHPRPFLDAKLEKSRTTVRTADSIVVSYPLVPAWKKLFSGDYAKEDLRPIAAFADDAITTLGKNININIDMPMGSIFTYMTAVKR